MIGLLLILIGIAYTIFILWCLQGWIKTKSFANNKKEFQTRVSVIIPARNEEDNIVSCLEALAKQSYPKSLTEIIICDDNSGDQTTVRVKNWIATTQLNAKIISSQGMSGKKQALNEGVKNATGELIVTTDADCTTGSNWLAAIVSYSENYSPALICGMVNLRKENNFLAAFQSLEQLGLTAIGAAGIYFRQPILCSGANLAYGKKIFEHAGGYNPSVETASGDDTQLMFRVANESPDSIHFLKSKEAIVYTNAALTLKEFFNQRRRWGSKVLKQKNVASVMAGLIVFLFHLSIIVSFILLKWKLVALLFAMKIIPEFVLLDSVLSFTGKKNLRKYIFPSQLIYPFYIVIAVLLSQTGGYSWKARKVS